MTPPPDGTADYAEPVKPRSVSSHTWPLLWHVVLRPHSVPSAWWFGFACLLVAGDYAVGPSVQFGFTFLVPVFLAAWYSGLTSALTLAVALPLARLALTVAVWNEPWTAAVVASAALRIAVLGFQAILVARLAEHERALQHEVDLLEELLPICMHCKAIRNDEGHWEPLERYISARTDSTFTHGICEACVRQHHPEVTRRQGR